MFKVMIISVLLTFLSCQVQSRINNQEDAKNLIYYAKYNVQSLLDSEIFLTNLRLRNLQTGILEIIGIKYYLIILY